MAISFTFLFPGQGAQALGMAVDLAGARPEARAVFDAGRELLGRDILGIVATAQRRAPFDPHDQPAIFLHRWPCWSARKLSAGRFRARRSRRPPPA